MMLSFITLSVLISFSPGIFFLNYSSDYWQVWSIENNGQVHQITASPFDKINFAPIGSDKIVYTSSDGIFLFDNTIKKETKIPQTIRLIEVNCNPKRVEAVFSFSRTGVIDSDDIWISDLSFQNLKQLAQMEGLQHQPAFCPDGERIVFGSKDAEKENNLWMVSRDGQGLKRTTKGSFDFFPSCSNKNEIVFSSNRTGDYEIWVLNLDDEKTRQLTHNPGLDTQPSWSHDWEQIIFVSDRSGYPEIWMMDRMGGHLKQVTTLKSEIRFPKWSPK